MMKRLFLFLFLVLAVCPAFAQVSPQTNSQFMATPSSGTGYLKLRAITPLDFNNGTGASGTTCLSGVLTWIACSISTSVANLWTASQSYGSTTTSPVNWCTVYYICGAANIMSVGEQGFASVYALMTTDSGTSAMGDSISIVMGGAHANPTYDVSTWSAYLQHVITAGAKTGTGTSHLGFEMSYLNESTAAAYDSIDPFTPNPPDVKSILRLDNGTGNAAGAPNSNNIHNVIQILNNQGLSETGIIIGNGALDTVSGTKVARAIELPPNAEIGWWNGAGNVGWEIFQNYNSGGGKVILNNNNFSIYNSSSGYNSFNATTTGVGINSITAPAYPLDVNGAIRSTQGVINGGTSGVAAGTCGPLSSIVGGNTAGAFTTTNACTGQTVVLNFNLAAPSGWSCRATNITHPTNLAAQNNYTTTYATIDLTSSAGDTFTWACTAF